MADPVDTHAAAAQRAAEDHLTACVMWVHEDDDEVPEPDTLEPFCGCTTCEVREVLYAAYPHLRAMWEADQAVT